ncbi:nucleoporin Pom152, partial [Aureobasidium melanogenum]
MRLQPRLSVTLRMDTAELPRCRDWCGTRRSTVMLDLNIDGEWWLSFESDGDDLLTSRLDRAVAVCPARVGEACRRTSVDTLLDGDRGEVLRAVIVVVVSKLGEHIINHTSLRSVKVDRRDTKRSVDVDQVVFALTNIVLDVLATFNSVIRSLGYSQLWTLDPVNAKLLSVLIDSTRTDGIVDLEKLIGAFFRSSKETVGTIDLDLMRVLWITEVAVTDSPWRFSCELEWQFHGLALQSLDGTRAFDLSKRHLGSLVTNVDLSLLLQEFFATHSVRYTGQSKSVISTLDQRVCVNGEMFAIDLLKNMAFSVATTNEFVLDSERPFSTKSDVERNCLVDANLT